MNLGLENKHANLWATSDSNTDNTEVPQIMCTRLMNTREWDKLEWNRCTRDNGHEIDEERR